LPRAPLLAVIHCSLSYTRYSSYNQKSLSSLFSRLYYLRLSYNIMFREPATALSWISFLRNLLLLDVAKKISFLRIPHTRQIQMIVGYFYSGMRLA
jgi:hypothetical protein